MTKMPALKFSSSDVVVACVAENTPYWANRVYNLAFSLRTFGGNLSQAYMQAYFVDGLEPRFRAMLQPLDVQCQVIGGFPAPVPQTNKLRMFEHFSREAGRILVALDCDVVIVSDFCSSLSSRAIRGVPASVSPLRPSEWRAVLSLLDLKPDILHIKTISTAEELNIPYLNSGVLFIPSQYCEELTDHWKHYIERLLTLHMTLNWPAKVWFYLDQLALACALLASKLPLEFLDVTHNFPTNVVVHKSTLHECTDIRILHYHRMHQSSGLLLPARTPVADRTIRRLNAALSEHRYRN